MIVLARHGNTFDPGEPALRVGSRTDLPLVEEGRRQAERLGASLAAEGFTAARIVAGPLRRTREFAAIVATALSGGDVAIDDRLSELDYGSWEGLTDAEIVARFGREDLEAWEERLIWPSNASWAEGEKAALDRIGTFMHDAACGPQPLLAVTSNGILRLLRRLIEGAPTRGQGKVRTGAVCRLVHEADCWTVLSWNVRE